MSVIGVRHAGGRGPKVNVRLPDGSCCWLPVSWTSLGAPVPGAPRLAGELPDFLALRKLVWTFAERCGAADGATGSDPAAAGAAGVGGTLAALAVGAASGAHTPDPGTVASDAADAVRGAER